MLLRSDLTSLSRSFSVDPDIEPLDMLMISNVHIVLVRSNLVTCVNGISGFAIMWISLDIIFIVVLRTS